MPTVTPKQLVQGMLLDDSAPGAPGLYRCSLSITAAVIRSMTLHNVDNSSHDVEVYVVASGDAEGNENRIIKATLEADGTLPDETLRVLAPGDYLSAFADAANVIAFRADGSEVSA